MCYTADTHIQAQTCALASSRSVYIGLDLHSMPCNNAFFQSSCVLLFSFSFSIA